MFKGLGGLGNIASLMKEAQNIGPKMQEVAEKLKRERVSGTAGGGMVTVHASGHGQILSVEFDSVLTEKADMEMVKDLLPAAVNDALTKSAELKAEMMQSVTGDIPIPGNIGDMMKQFMGGGGEPEDGDTTTNVQ
jgi:DNA-binding YbaB/EbfC family protein